MITGSSLFFPMILMKYCMLCLCHYGSALLSFWFQTDLGRENSASFLKKKARKTFSHHSHAFVTFYVQFLCSWSKFDWWVPAENLCSILKVVYFDSWSWQIFFCQLVMFLTVFFYWMYKMKYICCQESSVLHGWFVYWVFGWEMLRLSQSVIRFRMASLSFCLINA